MRDIADRREQRRVDHRGANAQQYGSRREAGEAGRDDNETDADRLNPHARRDQPLAADAIRPRAGEQLGDAPGRRIDRGEGSDLREVHPRGCEQQREQAPGHAVVEIVDETGLADARQVLVEQGGAPEDFALGRYAFGRQLTKKFRFDGNVVPGLAHDECRQQQPERCENDAEVERFGPQAVMRRDEAGRQRAAGDGKIARELVEPHRQPAFRRAGEVDLHDDRHRPG